MAKDKVGRSQKVSIDIKKNLVDLYFVEAAGKDPTAMQKHGIYTRLAEYGVSRGIHNLVDTDFSKCAEIRAYIDDKIQEAEKTPTEAAFAPIDFAKVLRMTEPELSAFLTQRDQYYYSVFQKSRYALSTFQNHNIQLRELSEMNRELKKDADEAAAQLQKLKEQLQGKTEECERLKKYIKKMIEPGMEESFRTYMDGGDIQQKTLKIAEEASRTPIKKPAGGMSQIIQLFTK